MTKKRLSSKWYIITVILTLFSIKSSGVLSAAQLDTVKYEFLSFNNISTEKGLEYLSKVKVGDVSRLPGSPTVLVTSSIPDNLQKAKIIRDLVDCSKDYSIKFIPWITKELPSAKQIMNNIGTMTIGDFSNPPAKDGHARTIVDTCEDKIIIVAPSNMIDRITETIDKLQKTNSHETTGQPLLAQTNDNKLEAEIKNRELNITPSLLAENVSGNDQNAENLNQRITDSAPVNSDSSYQAKPVETKSNLEAANSLVDISSIPNPDGEVTIDLPEQLTLTEFIGMAGPLLQMDFLYNSSDLIGKDVTINPNGVLKGNIKIRDVYNYLDSILQFKGLAMIRGRGNLVTIIPKELVLNHDAAFTRNTIEAGDSVVIDTFELKNISTSVAEDLIKKMQLGLQITAIPENKTLMITEYASRMPRIRALLDIVDKPGDPKKFRYRQLQHTKPQELVPKIQALAEKLDSVSVTISTTASPSIPPRPEKRSGESDASFRNRNNQWETEVRRITTEVSSRGSSPTASSAEPSTSTVFIDYDERTNRVLMIGLDKQLDQVSDLIDTLDVAQIDPREYEKYKIEHLDAEEVLKKLQALNVIPETEASKDSSRTTKSTQPTRITAGADPREIEIPSPSPTSGNGDSGTLQSVGEEPLAVLIASTNSLLINATPEQHTRIAAVINLVDKAREEIPFQIYQLKNTDPEHILRILEPLIEETVRGPEDKIESVIPKQDEQITIVADPNTSSLIVNANMRNQDWIASLIKVLDKRRPQVLIDVTLVQISKNDAFNYDLNLLSSIPDLTNTSGLTSALLPGISSGASNLVEPMTKAHYLDFQSKSDTGGTGFYGDKHINALLTMMQQKDYGRVMAKPQILVNDNQMGSISTIDTTYVTLKSSSPIGTINTTTVPQYETGIKFEGYDAGITLEITPHISESDLLRLDVLLTRKDFGTITGDRPPDTTDSTVQTKVTIPDGSTIILGGMLKMNQSKGGSKVPILGDLPFIGTLFTSANNSDIQRNLYVFVKAEIIRPPDEDGSRQVDLERISKRNQDAFEEYEKEFQDYQSFPGIKPTPMIPAKVLGDK
ncbi:MAG: hypothetical protein JXA96_02235 [Sedimentisphaerales bacterium]|nr:hypothetical protein [Sedimentisphaerales bacterium]